MPYQSNCGTNYVPQDLIPLLDMGFTSDSAMRVRELAHDASVAKEQSDGWYFALLGAIADCLGVEEARSLDD